MEFEFLLKQFNLSELAVKLCGVLLFRGEKREEKRVLLGDKEVKEFELIGMCGLKFKVVLVCLL